MQVQIPLRKVFVWLAVYACLFAICGGLPVPAVQFGAAIVVVTIFVLMDMWSSARDDTAASVVARCSIVVAYYSFAFAVCVAVCFALYEIIPEPATPPKPLPFLATVFHIVSGQLFRDIGDAIGRAIMLVQAYFGLFAVFSTISFTSSLFALRRFKSAKWLALLDLPGVMLFGYFVAVEILAFAGA